VLRSGAVGSDGKKLAGGREDELYEKVSSGHLIGFAEDWTTALSAAKVERSDCALAQAGRVDIF
jgi:hypothetical protein